MTATILTGAAGSGKTTTVIERLLAAEAEDFGRELWVLLPTRLQAEAFRTRLLEQAGRAALFNLRFFEFYELYDLLLDLAASPQRTIYPSASDRILRQVIWNLQEEGWLKYYDKIAQTPGFVSLVSRFIKELKQGVVTPEGFERAASTPKDFDLHTIYAEYQTFLQKNRLVDRDGAGWVALECLKATPDLVKNVGLLVVDGFDHFSPLQARLLGELIQQVAETLLTLTYEAHRTADASRSFGRTLERLQAKGRWEVQPIGTSANLSRRAALSHLEKQLFSLKPEPISVTDELFLIEAPDPRAEVKAVLREVKTLLLDGIMPDSIAVVVRDQARYIEALRSTAHAYGLPVTVRQQEALLQNPAIRVILSLLDLHQKDFPRRQMLDLLRSPYLKPPDFTLEEIDLLERVSLEKPIVKGKTAWLEGLTQAPRRDEDHEESDSSPLPAHLPHAMQTFCQRVTPPEAASPLTYVAWLQNLLGRDPAALADDQSEEDETRTQGGLTATDFDLYACVRSEAEEAVMVRDLYALHGFRGAVQEVLAAYELLETDEISWQSFRADLELALGRRTISDQATRTRGGRVLITTVFEARGLPHDYVFILGLSEGVFPQPQPEDALYSDPERLLLEAAGLDVETAAERAKEAALFYEMCALAGQRLILSRPTLDDGGNEWTPSIFWRSVVEVLRDAPSVKIALGVAPNVQQTANLRELAVSLSQALSQPFEQIRPDVWEAAAWMSQQTVWRNLRHGQSIELAREAAHLPFDAYTGVLADAELIGVVGGKITGRVWSASQFNELGQCGFRFFARRLLSLEAYEEPEEGLDVLQLGSVNHKILELTYQRFINENIPIHPDYLDYALTVLADTAERVLATAPRDFGFQITPFWAQERHTMLTKLEQLIRLDFSAESPISKLAAGERVTLQLEAPFGAERQPPLEIHGRAGTLRVRGFIDRLDLVGQGVVVMDYKSGSHTPRKADLEGGRNFQMLLYLLAAEQLLRRLGLPYHVVGGLFWSIQSNKGGDSFWRSDEVVDTAQDTLHTLVMAARAGSFPTKPSLVENGKCTRYCDFSRLCRMNPASWRKPGGNEG